MPNIEVIQNDIRRSTMVAAALMDGGTAVNNIIITPSTAPRPPVRIGISPMRVDIMKIQQLPAVIHQR